MIGPIEFHGSIYDAATASPSIEPKPIVATKFRGRLKSDSKILGIFPAGFVPVTSLYPQKVANPSGVHLCWLVPLAEITAEERHGLAVFSAEGSGEALEKILGWIEREKVFPLHCSNFTAVAGYTEDAS